MGAIPSLVANEVKIGVEHFAKFDPESSMQAIAMVQNATIADQDTVKQSADKARTGKQMLTMKAGEIEAALSALAKIDDGANKILDINSMMTALEGKSYSRSNPSSQYFAIACCQDTLLPNGRRVCLPPKHMHFQP
jgi:hypothetical protein